MIEPAAKDLANMENVPMCEAHGCLLRQDIPFLLCLHHSALWRMGTKFKTYPLEDAMRNIEYA